MQYILVTGGSRGIGKGIVQALSTQGFNVILNYNKSEENAKQIQQELIQKGYKIEIFKADVSNLKEVQNMIDFVISKFNTIDILINNAGISKWGLFTDLEENEWDKIINTNLKSMYNVSKTVLPYMINRKEGCIINISSIWGITGASCEVAYSASKAGVIGLTKALAKELGPSNIRVNAIAPGYIETDMNKNIKKEDIDVLVDEIPLGKLGRVEDITKCIKWLLEDSYTTGQVININGGWLI